MSTANKLTYLNQTKQELKQAINNIGGEVTDETTFREYANQLQGVYDNLPKTEYQEGTEVNLGVTIKGKLDFDNGVVGIGQTEQTTTQGYQLLDTSSFTQSITSQGITVEPNGDGTFRVYGTASANVSFIIAKYTFTSGNKYTMTNGLTDNQYGKYTLLMGTYAQWGQNTLINGEYSTFTAGTSEEFNILIQVYSGTTLNVVMKPLMYSGEYSSSKTFEAYTGGQASPNPSYPQEIEVVRGKNRLQLENGTNTTYNVTAVTENGKITLNGTPNSDTYSRLISTFTANTTDIFTLSPNKSATNSDIRLLYTINDGSLVNSDNSPQINLNTGDVVKVYLRISTTSQITNFTLQPQLEQGPTATPYLPYNTIEEVIEGKNRLVCRTDIPIGYTRTDNGITWERTGENTFKLNGTATANFTLIIGTTTPLKEKLTTGTTYTLSGCPSGGSDSTYRLQIFNFDGINSAFDVGNGATFVPNIPSTSNVAIRVFNGITVNNLIFNAQIEEGSTKTSFVPYLKTTYQLSLGDKELYEDSKIVRNSDGSWKFVDNYAKKTMRGDDIVRLTTEVSIGTNYRYLIQFAEGTDASIAWCNYAKFLKNYTVDNVHFYLYTNQLILFVPLTYQELKARADVVPLEVVYPLATPIETPITNETLISQLNAWYNAHSLNGTTIITSNGDLPMIIKCRGLKGE